MKIIYSKYEQDDIKKRMKGLLYGVSGTCKEMIYNRKPLHYNRRICLLWR